MSLSPITSSHHYEALLKIHVHMSRDSTASYKNDTLKIFETEKKAKEQGFYSQSLDRALFQMSRFPKVKFQNSTYQIR